MTYMTALAEVTTEHRAEIQEALAQARREITAAEEALEAARRTAVHLECLLAVSPSAVLRSDAVVGAPGTSKADRDGPMTLHAAMHRVLLDAPNKKLRAGEIIAEIDRRGLYRMRDGRLPESQQIHARAGHYPDMFGKDGSYFFPK